MSNLAEKHEDMSSGYQRATLTGRERRFAENDIIVSKTDARGILTYVNKIFLQVSGYDEDEMLGKPHNVIRHPDMPRAVFKLLWDTIRDRREIFAYVVNRCKNGDHYWVLAHVTPTLGPGGDIIGFHSSRRAPKPEAIRTIMPIYEQLRQEESRHAGRTAAEAGVRLLEDMLKSKGSAYDQFVLSI